MLSDHSFEEMRAAALDLLAGRERSTQPSNSYQSLLIGVGEVFTRRELTPYQTVPVSFGGSQLSQADSDLFLEVFWGLFREGIITLGLNDANRDFPFFRVTQFGRRIIESNEAYFFHDVSSYENGIRAEIPTIDNTTVLYLKEAM